MSKIFIYCFLTLLILTGKVYAVTLDEALFNVSEKNHKILSGQSHIQSILEDSNISSIVYRPKLTLNSSIGHKQIETTTFSKYSPTSIDFNVKQTIFDGYKGRYLMQKAKEEFYKAEFEQSLLEQSIFLDTIKAYIDLLHYDKLLKLNNENKIILGEELESSLLQFSLGDIKRSDLLLAEAKYNKAIFDISDIEKIIINLSTVFINLTEMKPVDLTVPVIKYNSLPASLNEAILIANTEHPRILLNQHVINSANLDTKIIESEKFPQLNLNANYSNDWNSLSTIKRSKTLSILGSISIPLYDSGLINSKLRKSSLLENKFKLNALHTQNEVIENITNNWNLLESLEDSLSSENNFLLVNIEILKAIDEERKNGISSNLDFLNAQNSVIQSKIRLSKYQFDQLYYSYKLLNSIGRLNLKSLLS